MITTTLLTLSLVALGLPVKEQIPDSKCPLNKSSRSNIQAIIIFTVYICRHYISTSILENRNMKVYFNFKLHTYVKV